MSEQQDLIPMAVGERLSRRRRERKLSVEAAARSLKVPTDVLRAIESDDLERFAPLYRKGYIRSYARFLGFGEEDVEGFLKDEGSPMPSLQPAYSLPSRPRSSDRWLRATSYILASLLIGTLAWQLTHEAVRLSQGEAAGSDSASSAADGQASDADSPGRGSSHVNASIAALDKIQRQKATPSGGVGQQAWDVLREPAGGAGEDAHPNLHELSLATSGDSWVEIADASGKQLEMDLVRGGSERRYRGQAPFSIVFGRASAVELSLDGRPVDLSGHTSGNVAQLTLHEGDGGDQQDGRGDDGG